MTRRSDEPGNWCHLEVKEILRASDAAFLLLFRDGRQEWVPRSHVSDADDYQAGDVNCTVSVTSWLAGVKGLS